MSGKAQRINIRKYLAKCTSTHTNSWPPQDEALAQTAVTLMESTCWGFPSHRQSFGSFHSISKVPLWLRRLQRHCHLSLLIWMHQQKL